MKPRVKVVLCLAGGLLCVGSAGLLLQTYRGSWQEDNPVIHMAGPALIESLRPSVQSDDQTLVEARMIFVHISGAVNRPGVYQVPEGTRLYQLVEQQAGGFHPNADKATLNLAAPVKDGEHIHVGTFLNSVAVTKASFMATPSKGRSAVNVSTNVPVNINTATATELDKLPGVGPSMAKKIIAWRRAHGPFRSAEDLLQVDGIGPKKLESMKPRLRF